LLLLQWLLLLRLLLLLLLRASRHCRAQLLDSARRA
jgi:hypothetical protein